MLPGLPTVFVTGNPDCFTDYRFEAWERLVPKPFSGESLVTAIEAVRPVAVRAAGIALDGAWMVSTCARRCSGW